MFPVPPTLPPALPQLLGRNVVIQYLFGLLSQRLFGQIIVQAVPNEYICLFYVSIQII